MKNYVILAFSLLIFCSCGVGGYFPYANNNYGIQTQVVLDRANYRVVDNVEVVIEVNNSNLKRKDVERSAIGELMRRYKLTGSQAFINVNVEEIDRQTTKLFFVLFGLNLVEHKQYVAARATIIEFLQENGEPVVTAPSNCSNEFVSKAIPDNQIRVAPQLEPTEIQTQENTVLEETLADSKFASDVLNKAKKTINRLNGIGSDIYFDFDKFSEISIAYEELYTRTKSNPTKKATCNLSMTTQLVSAFLEGKKSPNEISDMLEEEADIHRRIEILVEYAQKNLK